MKYSDLNKLIDSRLEYFQESNFQSSEARRVISSDITSEISRILEDELGVNLRAHVEEPLTHVPKNPVVHLHNGAGDLHCGPDCDGSCLN